MDRASDKTLRKQIERERRFLKRARKLRLSDTFVKDSEARIKRYERLLDG